MTVWQCDDAIIASSTEMKSTPLVQWTFSEPMKKPSFYKECSLQN